MKNKLKKQKIIKGLLNKHSFSPYQNAMGISLRIDRNLFSRSFAHMPQTQVHNRGFTLVELLLYIGIFSILVVTLFQLFTSIIDTQVQSQSSSSVFLDGQYILNRFRYDIERTKSIIAPSSSGAQGTTVQISIDGVTYIYTLTNGNITLTNNATSTTDQLNSLNTTVSNLNFTRLSDTQGKNTDTLIISFRLTSNIIERKGLNTQNFKTTIGIRPKQ